MRSPIKPSQHAKKRGMSLVEMATVLGIIGTVAGGIWVAAAAVRDNHNLSQTVAGIMQISRAVQNVITLQQGTAMGCCSNINNLITKLIPPPAGWQFSGTTIYTPYNGMSASAATFGDRMDFRLRARRQLRRMTEAAR